MIAADRSDSEIAEDPEIVRTADFGELIERIRLTNRTYHFAAEFAEVGG